MSPNQKQFCNTYINHKWKDFRGWEHHLYMEDDKICLAWNGGRVIFIVQPTEVNDALVHELIRLKNENEKLQNIASRLETENEELKDGDQK